MECGCISNEVRPSTEISICFKEDFAAREVLFLSLFHASMSVLCSYLVVRLGLGLYVLHRNTIVIKSMSEAILGSYGTVEQSSSSNKFGYILIAENDPSLATEVTLGSEIKSIVLLHVTVENIEATVSTFGFKYDQNSSSSETVPLFLNRASSGSISFHIIMLSSTQSIKRYYSIANTTTGIKIIPHTGGSYRYTWHFHILALPYTITKYP